MKVATIIGARPQFIKASTVSRALAEHPDIEEVIIHTGQHFDDQMSEVFFDELEIPAPHYKLGIGNLSHGAMTGRMIEAIEQVLIKESPDWVVVHGDTNSTLAGAIAASKLQIQVAHVEAGLRSHNMNMPEEINRVLVDKISNKLFCPTQVAVDNLVKEGYRDLDAEIELVGDVMCDALNFSIERKKGNERLLQDNGLESGRFVIATFHRAENTDSLEKIERVIDILNGLNQLAPVVLPVHPRVRNVIEELASIIQFKTIEPLSYFDMIRMVDKSGLVVTDSGGLQKEAYMLGKYCITLRGETEWTELVEREANFVLGLDKSRILDRAKALFGKKPNDHENLYGDGHAAQMIADSLFRSGAIHKSQTR